MRTFEVGELVDVWRGGRGIPGKRSHAYWRKPATIMDRVHGNYWLAMAGTVIKAAPEQIRFLTAEERRAQRLVEDELRTTKLDLENIDKQKNFIAITADKMPPMEPA